MFMAEGKYDRKNRKAGKDSYERLKVEITVSEMRNMPEGIQSHQTLQKKSRVLET